MSTVPDGGWTQVRTSEEARAAYQGCSEILFVKGTRERFDATSLTQVIRDEGPNCREPVSEASSICAQYLQWLCPRGEFARPVWNDAAARIELWTNGRQLHFFEASPMTAARRLVHQPSNPDRHDRHNRQIRQVFAQLNRRSSRHPKSRSPLGKPLKIRR